MIGQRIEDGCFAGGPDDGKGVSITAPGRPRDRSGIRYAEGDGPCVSGWKVELRHVAVVPHDRESSGGARGHPDNLAVRVDAKRRADNVVRQLAQRGYLPVLPQDSALDRIRRARPPDDVTGVVHIERRALQVAGECGEEGWIPVLPDRRVDAPVQAGR